MFEILKSGGWLMAPIILCSVLAFAIIVERFWVLQERKVVPRNMLAKVWGWLKTGQLTPDKIKQLRKKPGLGYLLAVGLSNARHGREITKEAIEEAATYVVHELERYMNALGTIAAITPLLGLLGTVVGMIHVFNEIVTSGAGNAGNLASGISEALVTTASGLCIGIPALICHRILQRRIKSIVVSMEQECIKLVDVLHGDRDNKDGEE